MAGLSNCLRALAFEPAAEFGTAPASEFSHRELGVVTFEVDDLSAEDLSNGLDHVRALPGVHDVVQGVVFGKKGRVATQVQVLVAPDRLDDAIRLCFAETTTIGLRFHVVRGAALPRGFDTVEVDGRALRTKHVTRPDGSRTAKAEASDVSTAPGHAARLRLRREAEAHGPVAPRRAGAALMEDATRDAAAPARRRAALHRSRHRGRGQRRHRQPDARHRGPRGPRRRRDVPRRVGGRAGRRHGARRAARRRARLAAAGGRGRRVRRRRLRRQPHQPLLLLQDQPLRHDRPAHGRADGVGRQHGRPRRVPPGARRGARPRRAPPLPRGRHRQAHRAGPRPPARARRPQRAAGRALPVEPRRDRHRHPPRGAARHPRGRARPRAATSRAAPCDAACAPPAWCWSSTPRPSTRSTPDRRAAIAARRRAALRRAAADRGAHLLALPQRLGLPPGLQRPGPRRERSH